MAGTPKNNKQHPCNKRHSRYLGEKKNKRHSSQLTTLRALVKKNQLTTLFPINDTLASVEPGVTSKGSLAILTRLIYWFKAIYLNTSLAWVGGGGMQKPHCYYCSLPSSSTVPSTHNAPYPSPLVNKNSSTHLNKWPSQSRYLEKTQNSVGNALAALNKFKIMQ